LLSALLEQKPLVTLQRFGMQALFKSIVQKDGINAICNAQVTEIDRNTSESSKPITVTAQVNGESKTYEADFVFIAIPAHQALPLMKEALPQEKEIFGSLKSKVTVSTLYSSKVLRPDEKGTTLFPENITPYQDGRHVMDRVASRGIFPQVQLNPNGRRVAVATQYYRENPANSNSQLTHDLEEEGHTDIKIVTTQAFESWPSFSSDQVTEGYPWKVLNMQGRHRTCYIGSSVSFDSLEDVISYNHLLFKIFNLEL
jgi:hypothetical protein